MFIIIVETIYFWTIYVGIKIKKILESYKHHECELSVMKRSLDQSNLGFLDIFSGGVDLQVVLQGSISLSNNNPLILILKVNENTDLKTGFY